jgi:hypothetical protein
VKLLLRWIAALGWDGALPIVLLIVPVIARRLPPKEDALRIGLCVVVPICAALIRSMWAYERLAGDSGEPSFFRQATFAFAIIVLLLFDAASSLALMERLEEVPFWLTMACMYLLYVVLLSFALGLFSGDSKADKWNDS